MATSISKEKRQSRRRKSCCCCCCGTTLMQCLLLMAFLCTLTFNLIMDIIIAEIETERMVTISHFQSKVKLPKQYEERKKKFAGSDELRMQDVPDDPLRASNFTTPRGQAIDLKPATPYLGVLLDGGRHYFPVIWIKRLLDRLSDMNYNLLHFRLTDDQTFNVLLKSHPELAYPTAVNNPDRLVYTVDELREITAYAKERGIRIMPEINVPGHAGSWAGGRPDLIVHCPKFICNEGYGLPLNVSHPDVDMILQNVLTEIVDIFDDPPFLHLGGDEVNMANPCFTELGKQLFDYQAFEVRLKLILQKINYPNDQVVRWEMTGQKKLNRAGRIEQFWESHPGVRHDATGPFFVSTWLYFDTNGDQTAYDVYQKTRVNFNLKDGKLPTAIIAGTFELSTEFWYDRNVLGKLLAVAMGATNNKTYPEHHHQLLLDEWKIYCEQLGFGTSICDTKGVGTISHGNYLRKWEYKWQVWKQDICDRLVITNVNIGVFDVVFLSLKLSPIRFIDTFASSAAKYISKTFLYLTQFPHISSSGIIFLPRAKPNFLKILMPYYDSIPVAHLPRRPVPPFYVTTDASAESVKDRVLK